MGRASVEIFSAFSDRVHSRYKASGRICPLDALRPVTVGDMRIMPIPADHSAYDAFMYLVLPCVPQPTLTVWHLFIMLRLVEDTLCATNTRKIYWTG